MDPERLPHDRPSLPRPVGPRAPRRTLLLLALGCGSALGRPTLALTRLEAIGVDSAQASLATERLREALLRARRVKVLEREAMERILREQAFQQSGACDEACASRAGKLLAVDRMVLGSLARSGGLWSVGARLVDVGTGEVVASASEDGRSGGLEDVLERAVPRLARRLLEGLEHAPAVVTRVDLYVGVDDPDATLRVDGRPIGGTEPFLVPGLEPGLHRLEARGPKGIARLTLELGERSPVRVDLALRPEPAALLLGSRPLGAQVFLGEVLAGTTPLRLDSLAPGTQRFLLRREGHLDTLLTADLGPGSDTRLDVALVPAGRLSFDPPGDGTVRLERPFESLAGPADRAWSLRAGSWRVRLDEAGWAPIDTLVEVRAGREVRLERRRATPGD